VNTNQSFHHVSASIGTIGPLQLQARQVLGCTTPGRSERSAAIALSHAGLPSPGRDLTCRHFLVPGEFPILVLAAVHHQTCFYFALNLADSDARHAFSHAYGIGGLNLVMLDPEGGACSYSLDVRDEEQVREILRRYETAFYRVERSIFLLRLGELASKLPSEFANLEPESAKCTQHTALFLLGDSDMHLAGLSAALKSASLHDTRCPGLTKSLA
jgi:hypothetical protein